MLSLRSLQHFVAICRHHSYARAAEDLGITQSALSRSIQAFEQQLGLQLFDRDQSGATPTTEGRRLLDGAVALLANATDLELQFKSAAHAEAGRIRFGMAPVPARTLLFSALSERMETVPNLAHDVLVRNIEALWPMLTNGDIEFIIGPGLPMPDGPRVRTEVLGSFPVSLIVRPGHPLLDEDRQDAAYPILLSSEGPTPSVLLAQNRIRAATVHFLEDFETLILLTRNSDAVWVSSACAVAQELAQGKLCELSRKKKPNEAGRFDVTMFTLSRRTQSPAVLALKKLFIAQIHALAPGSP